MKNTTLLLLFSFFLTSVQSQLLYPRKVGNEYQLVNSKTRKIVGAYDDITCCNCGFIVTPKETSKSSIHQLVLDSLGKQVYESESGFFQTNELKCYYSGFKNNKFIYDMTGKCLNPYGEFKLGYFDTKQNNYKVFQITQKEVLVDSFLNDPKEVIVKRMGEDSSVKYGVFKGFNKPQNIPSIYDSIYLVKGTYCKVKGDTVTFENYDYHYSDIYHVYDYIYHLKDVFLVYKNDSIGIYNQKEKKVIYWIDEYVEFQEDYSRMLVKKNGVEKYLYFDWVKYPTYINENGEKVRSKSSFYIKVEKSILDTKKVFGFKGIVNTQGEKIMEYNNKSDAKIYGDYAIISERVEVQPEREINGVTYAEQYGAKKGLFDLKKKKYILPLKLGRKIDLNTPNYIIVDDLKLKYNDERLYEGKPIQYKAFFNREFAYMSPDFKNKKNSWGIHHYRSGRDILPIDNDYDRVYSMRAFNQNMFVTCKVVSNSDVIDVELRDENFNLVIPKGKYSNFEQTNEEGYIKVTKIQNGEEYVGLIDSTGKEVIPVKYFRIMHNSSNNQFRVYSNDGIGIYDISKNREVIKCGEYKIINMISENLYRIQKEDKKWYLWNDKNKQITKVGYDDIQREGPFFKLLNYKEGEIRYVNLKGRVYQ